MIVKHTYSVELDEKDISEAVALPEATAGSEGVKEEAPKKSSRRTNITFSADNYSYLFKTARRGGLSGAAFLNLLLDKCRAGEIDVKKFIDFDFDV